MATENNLLFQDFPGISTQEWMDKITADLKGAPFDKKLVWRTNENFEVLPFYRSEDLEKLGYLDVHPADFPYVRGNQPKSNGWFVRQDVKVEDAKTANAKVLDILMKGVDSVGFNLANPGLVAKEQLDVLFKNIFVDSIETNFQVSEGHKELLTWFVDHVKLTNRDPKEVFGSLNHDPLGNLLLCGNLKNGIDAELETAASLIRNSEILPEFRALTVNAKHFGNAGSSIVQELAFGLSMGAEYLSQMTSKGISVNDAANNIRFAFSVGSNYFLEIAKLRAARLLWAQIVKAFKPTGVELAKMVIHCETSLWNKTVYDPYVNMLRTQTEAMSASLAGVNSIIVHPFDKVYTEPSIFSERIARNQQLLLKEESRFDQIVDPSSGSYYIENLTDKIAEEAWKLFKETEEAGGLIESIKSGAIQAKVHEISGRRKKYIERRKEVLVGTNQYPNQSETAVKIVSQPEYKSDIEGQFCMPLNMERGAAEFEKLRMAVDKAVKTPKVFMLTYGNLAMRRARAQFASNFFACAGYEITDNIGFKTSQDGVDAALKENADIIVICSSDDAYDTIAPEVFNAVNGMAQVVVAGAPAGMEELKAKGIEHFIHIKSNVLQTLKGFNKLMGIE